MTEWKRFEAALAGALGTLADDQYLVMTTRAGNRFVQFAGQGGAGLRVEAASNRVLEANERLDATGLDQLDALGWNRPTHDLSEDDERDSGSCNHYFEYSVPVPFTTVADQAVRTFTDVFRVRHTNELVYTAFVDGGPPLLFPTLGVEVDPTVWPVQGAADRNLSVERLRERVHEVVDAEFEGVSVLDDGSAVQIRFGSAAVFARVSGDPPVVHVWSPVVEEVDTASARFLEELAQRNLGARFVRFAAVNGVLIAGHELFGNPFVPEHLVYAVSLVGDLASSIDEEFCDRFGGHSFFRNGDDHADDQ